MKIRQIKDGFSIFLQMQGKKQVRIVGPPALAGDQKRGVSAPLSPQSYRANRRKNSREEDDASLKSDP